MQSTKKVGDEWELVAIKYLQRNEYQILDTNFRFWRFGEIDIICEKEGRIHFVEVKFRTNLKFGNPEESVTKSKLRKSKKTIEFYVLKNWLDFGKIQFDVISILKGEESYKLKHYKNLGI